LQYPIFACGWIAHHDERRSVRVIFISDRVDRQVDHFLALELGVFERRFRCVASDQPSGRGSAEHTSRHQHFVFGTRQVCKRRFS